MHIKDNDFAELAEFMNDGKLSAPKSESDHIFDGNQDSDPLSDFTSKQDKADAMAIALQWQEDGDSTYDALENLVYGMSADHSLDDDEGESSGSSEDHYNDLLEKVGSALIELGASENGVTAFIEDEDDEAGALLSSKLSSVMDSLSDDDPVLINRFAVNSDMLLDANVKAVRNGKFVLINNKRRRKRKQSAKQRAALKRNRKKAHNAKARKNRKKSSKLRKSRGMS